MPLKEIADRQNLLHAKSDPSLILRHTLEDVRLGDTAIVSSFGAESVVLLHMAAQINNNVPVIFLDTEMLFAETLTYQKELAETLGLTDVRVIRPNPDAVFLRDNDGLLHQADTDACCTLRKTEPLKNALAPFGSWVTGRKQYQGGKRATLPVFEKEAGTPRFKINPLARWDAGQIAAYMDTHNLPRHPLVQQGYPSIGCMPCTARVSDLGQSRAGRWEGQEKTECGIHF